MKYLKKYHELFENQKLKELFYSNEDDINTYTVNEFIRIASKYRSPEYTNLCTDSSAKPKEDLEKFLNYLNEHGFYEDKIIKMLSLYNKEVLNSKLSKMNGVLDIFFYHYVGRSYYLSSGTHKFDPMDYSNEVIIKYLYGYHNTPYGKIFIESLYGDSGIDSKEIIEREIFSAQAKKTWEDAFLNEIWNTVWFGSDYYGDGISVQKKLHISVDERIVKEYSLKVIQINPENDIFVTINKEQFYDCCKKQRFDEETSTKVFLCVMEFIYEMYRYNVSTNFDKSKIIIK
jgi:hypothetical protein